MKLFEKIGFKSEEDFNNFKQEFGNNWGIMLLMLDPAYYGNVISEEFNIKRPTFENIKIYQIEFIHEYFKDTYYKQLIKNTNIKLYSIEDTLNINLNSLSDDNLIYDEENNIYIYEDPLTNLKYAFYLINCNLTNSI